MTAETRRCAVLGSPISHSLSPVLHRAAYDELGLDWRYDAVETAEADLADFVRGLGEEWRGLSLTMPLKRAVLPLLDHTDVHVDRSSVANTVVLEGGRRWGHNTDIPGATAALRERGIDSVATATVLGGGATAASLVLALADLGAERITVAARDEQRARDALGGAVVGAVAAQVSFVSLAEAPLADVVASTVPSAAVTDVLLDRLADAPTVFDVIYDPWPTALAAAARGTVVSGLDLLVHQANLQVQLFTGTSRDLVDAMRAAGEQALAERHG